MRATSAVTTTPNARLPTRTTTCMTMSRAARWPLAWAALDIDSRDDLSGRCVPRGHAAERHPRQRVQLERPYAGNVALAPDGPSVAVCSTRDRDMAGGPRRGAVGRGFRHNTTAVRH